MLTPDEKVNRKKYVKQLIHGSEDRNDPIVREVYMLEEEDIVGEEESRGLFQKIKDKISSVLW